MSLGLALRLSVALRLRSGSRLSTSTGSGTSTCASASSSTGGSAGSSVVSLGLARLLASLEVALGNTGLTRVTSLEQSVTTLHRERVLGDSGEVDEVEALDAGVSRGAYGDEGQSGSDDRKELHCCCLELKCCWGSMRCMRLRVLSKNVIDEAAAVSGWGGGIGTKGLGR